MPGRSYKRISLTEARATLSRLISEIKAGDAIVIERQGKALAAIVSLADLNTLECSRPLSPGEKQALALTSSWEDLPDQDTCRLLSEKYVEPEEDMAPHAGEP